MLSWVSDTAFWAAELMTKPTTSSGTAPYDIFSKKASRFAQKEEKKRKKKGEKIRRSENAPRWRRPGRRHPKPSPGTSGNTQGPTAHQAQGPMALVARNVDPRPAELRKLKNKR
jgi:hypothetical protein